jgi:hypothetical protein
MDRLDLHVYILASRTRALIEEINPTSEDFSMRFGAPAKMRMCATGSFGIGGEQQIPTSGPRPPRDDN